jgi:hypothetical protein
MLELYPRPTLRADCLPGGSNAERPCPYLGCRYHLGLEATDVGSLKLVTGWDDGGPSCALDVADEGPATLEQVGDLLGLTRERTRQVEVLALHRAREGALRLGGRHDDE